MNRAEVTKGIFIALGSNMGDRKHFLTTAIASLDEDEDIQVVKRSASIETEAAGPVKQGSFLNCVIEITTCRTPQSLLGLCIDIERSLGRVRTTRWGPRTIDLDIILFAKHIINEPKLTIPHPEMHSRDFVLRPLVEIAPHCVHPTNGLTATQMLGAL